MKTLKPVVLLFLFISCQDQTTNNQTSIADDHFELIEKKSTDKFAGFTETNDTINQMISEFYTWYQNAVQYNSDEKSSNLFHIPFVEKGEDGNCVLNTQCFDNLRKYKISERYLKKLKQECDECENNIRNFPFEQIDFETISEKGCGFNELYVWINSQEGFGTFEPGKMKMISDKEFVVLVYIDKFYDSPMNIKVIKEGNVWKIDDYK